MSSDDALTGKTSISILMRTLNVYNIVLSKNVGNDQALAIWKRSAQEEWGTWYKFVENKCNVFLFYF
mgnify:CR=1 FL=1